MTCKIHPLTLRDVSVTYVPWVLEYVYKHTGMLCVAAVCCEGYENIGYTELMRGAEEVTRRRRENCMTWETAFSFCVIISMGKDVYKLTKDMPRDKLMDLDRSVTWYADR